LLFRKLAALESVHTRLSLEVRGVSLRSPFNRLAYGFFCLFLVFELLWAVVRAHADTLPIEIRGSGTPIPGLIWSTQSPELEMDKDANGEQYFYVTLSGQFTESNASVLWNTIRIIQSQQNVPVEFSQKIKVFREKTQISIESIDAKGKLHSQVIQIRVPQLDLRKQILMQKLFFVSASMGYSLITYEEQNNVNVSISALTAKLSLAYQIDPGKWDVALSGYGTALQLGSSHPATTRFIGVNLRLGRFFSQPASPWSWGILAGGYYTTMIVSDDLFGFKNMTGPQLFPVLRYQVNKESSVSGYAKYSPILSAEGLLPFSQRELAFGMSYQRALSSTSSLSFSLDLADLQLEISTVAVSSRSLSASVGINF